MICEYLLRFAIILWASISRTCDCKNRLQDALINDNGEACTELMLQWLQNMPIHQAKSRVISHQRAQLGWPDSCHVAVLALAMPTYGTKLWAIVSVEEHDRFNGVTWPLSWGPSVHSLLATCAGANLAVSRWCMLSRIPRRLHNSPRKTLPGPPKPPLGPKKHMLKRSKKLFPNDTLHKGQRISQPCRYGWEARAFWHAAGAARGA